MESRVQKPRYKSNKKEVDEEEGNGYIKRNGNGSCGGNCDVVVANAGGPSAAAVEVCRQVVFGCSGGGWLR